MTPLLENSRKSSIYVVPTQILLRLFGFITTIVLARKLTVDDFGVYNLFLGSMLFFDFLTNPGLADSLQRFLSEYAKFNKYRLFFRTLFFSLTYRMVSGVIVFTAAILLFDRYSTFFGISTQFKSAFVLFCLGTYALFQVDFLELAFNALFLHQLSSVSRLISQILRATQIIVVLMVFRGGLTEIFAGELVAYGFGAILLWFLFFRNIYSPKIESAKGDSDRIEWKRYLRFSAFSAATIPGTVFYSYAMDLYIISIMATTRQVGIYALGSRASQMLLSVLPHKILNSVLRPAFYHHYSSAVEKKSELNLMFRFLVVLIAAALFPISALVGIQAGHILLFIFNAPYAESAVIFLMLLTFNVFTILHLPSDLVLQAIEKVQARFYSQVFAVYNVVAAIMLFAKFGIIGVAFATGSALMMECLFLYFMARYYTGISLCWGPLLKIGIYSVAAAGIAYCIGQLGDSLLWMFISMASGCILYLILAIVSPFFNDNEKGLINRFSKRHIFNV
jgi:O-antigen/teichoic acid export membrane protein